MNVRYKNKFWVLRRGEAYFNTWNTDFYKKEMPSKENDFNNAYRFQSLEKVNDFLKAHIKRRDGGWMPDIIEVNESVSINYKFKKVS